MKHGNSRVEHFGAHHQATRSATHSAHTGHTAEADDEFLTGEFVLSRTPCVQAHRVLIKVGTQVATRAEDERLALGRLGALSEVIKELKLAGRQIILVICGANTVGRQKLRYQQILHSSPLEYQMLSQADLSGPACASAGQSGVMALWDKMFTLLGMSCAQLLVSLNDFSDSKFCETLQGTLQALLEKGVVPILNEKPSSTDVQQEAPLLSGSPHASQQGQSFVDNDGLAACVSECLEVDLTLFLSNMEGVPWDSTANRPRSPRNAPEHPVTAPSILHTYCPDIHGKSNEIVNETPKTRKQPSFGQWGPRKAADDSKTRSLQSKVAAAWRCAMAGSTAVVLNGCDPENVVKVLAGERVGTLFNKNASLEIALQRQGPREDLVHERVQQEHAVASADAEPQLPRSLRGIVNNSRAASRELSSLSAERRSAILLNLAAALEEHAEEIVLANLGDVAHARAHGADVPDEVVQRMSLDLERLQSVAQGVRALANMDDPVDRVLRRMELTQGLELEQVAVPLGVVLCIFEARPDVMPQVVALAIRAGNAVLLKGSDEMHNTNELLHSLVIQSIAPVCSASLVSLVHAREDVDDLLRMVDKIDLIVPRGSSALVSSVQDRTSIPVLGHSDGVCTIYIDEQVDMKSACRVCVDSKTDYPAACNAVDIIFVHRKHREGGGIFQLLASLRRAGVEVFGGKSVCRLLNVPSTPSTNPEFKSLKVVIDEVEDMQEAIRQIHLNGSAHTDAICTSNQATAEEFLRRVDSACVFDSCSTRFSDGYRFGLGGELGITTGRIHARGPVGVEGLLTTKYVVRGKGHLVQGDKDIVYTHRPIPLSA